LRAGLGPTMCQRFYFPYARKLWGLDPSELAGEQARRRVTAGSAARLLAGGDRLEARRVWSTVPLPALARMADPAPHPAVLQAAGRLDFRAMVLVYLILEGGRYSPYDAHYLPDPGTPVTRVSEPA